MRIFLLSANREKDPCPVAPLGLAYVADAARAAGHEVALLDLCFSNDVETDIARSVSEFSPGLIGVSIRNVDNLTWPAPVSYVAGLRAAVDAVRRASAAPIVAGGPGFSIFPGLLLRRLDIDLGIVGEGEETFCAIADRLGRGEGLPDLPNLVRRGAAVPAGPRAGAPFRGNGSPSRDLLDNARYLDEGGTANLQTKRGCPFGCVYCTYPHINGPTLRLRPASEVAEELAAMSGRFGIDRVFFVDDIFNWPYDHAMEVCEAIVARGLSVDWTCFATPLGMTVELARAMKRAGCRGVEFGTDAGSPAMLTAMRKPFGADAIRRASSACREAGLPDAHYLIFGGPGETRGTLEETFRAFDAIRPRAVLALLGVRIYPNTPLHPIAVSDGLVAPGDDLLSPRFYISPRLGEDALGEAVREHARSRANWVVPGLGIRSDPSLLQSLRRKGYRGPLWDLL